MATVAKCASALNDKDKQTLTEIVNELQTSRNEKTPSVETKIDSVNELLEALHEERLAFATDVESQGGYVTPYQSKNTITNLQNTKTKEIFDEKVKAQDEQKSRTKAVEKVKGNKLSDEGLSSKIKELDTEIRNTKNGLKKKALIQQQQELSKQRKFSRTKSSASKDETSQSDSPVEKNWNKMQQLMLVKYLKRVIRDVSKTYNLKNVRAVSYEEALKIADDLGMTEVYNDILNGANGYALDMGNGEYAVYVRPGLQQGVEKFTTAHEINHVLQWTHYDNASEAEKAGIKKAFDEWLADKGADVTSIEEMIFSRKGHDAAKSWMENIKDMYRVGDLDPRYKEYILRFDEFTADMMAKEMLREARPKSIVGQFFYDLSKVLVRVFGYDEVGRYLDNVRGATGLRSVHNTKFFKSTEAALGKVKNSDTMKAAGKVFRAVLYDKDQRLRVSKNKYVIELADLLFKERGDTRQDNTYWAAKIRAMGKFDTRLNDIMKDTSPEEHEMLLDILHGEEDVDIVLRSLNEETEKEPNEGAVKDLSLYNKAKQIRSLLEDIAVYIEKGTGEKVKRRKNYFPQIVNLEILADEEQEFLDMVSQEKYTKDLQFIAKKWKLDDDSTNEQIARALYDHLVGNNGLDDDTPISMEPRDRFLNSRLMKFLTGDDLTQWNGKFLEKDVMGAVSAYITQAAKRTEYERRFGGGKLQMLMENARKSGATKEVLDLMQDSVLAETGQYGSETARWLNKKLRIPMPPPHSPINPHIQKVQSVAMSAANVMILGLSTFTSLADPIGIAVRTGDVKTSFQAMKEGLKAALSKDPDYAVHLAEELGIINETAIQEALQHEYSGVYMPRVMKKINDTYFKAIMLEQWTKTTRIMATKAAMLSIVKNDGKRLNKELGLKEGDVQLDENGRLKLLNYDEFADASKVDKARDSRLKSAISEFVDESILRPTPSQRPLWASDPHFALMFHLKSFMFAFQKTIILPALREARLHNNMKPIAALGAYIPTMIVVGLLKDLIKGVPVNPYKEDWGSTDYMWDAAQKGGLTGVFQPIFDMFRDQSFGDTGIGAYGSPVFDPESTFGDLPVPFRYYTN